VFGGEGVQIGALQVEYADETILKQERNDQFRTDSVAVGEFHIPLVQADVAHADGAPVARGMAGNAFKKRKGQINVDSFFVMLGKNTFQLRRSLIPDHHIKKMIVDDFLDAIGDVLQKFIAREDRGQLTADVEQQGKALVVLDGRTADCLTAACAEVSLIAKARLIA
jgi:hypothetical protein